MELKICNFLSTLFRNKDFISQEGPILADVLAYYSLISISPFLIMRLVLLKVLLLLKLLFFAFALMSSCTSII